MGTKISNAPYINPVPGQFPLVCEGPIPKVSAIMSLSEYENHLDIMQKCGFNCFTKFIDADDTKTIIKKYLETAEKLGLKFLVRQWALADPDQDYCKKFVDEFKNYKAVGGWNIGDEPDSSAVARWIASSKIILENDPSRINFFGLSTNPAEPIGISIDNYYQPFGNAILDDPINKRLITYLRYIQAEMSPSLWLFDYYPIREEVDNGVATGKYYKEDKAFFRYLELFRAMSLETKRPFWSYVLLRAINFYSNNYNDYIEKKCNKCCFGLSGIMPKPTEGALRYASFTALAYGAQGLIFWGYCRGKNKLQTYHVKNNLDGEDEIRCELPNEEYAIAPIMRNNEKTEVWETLKSILTELNQYSNKLLDAESLEVMHTNNVTGTKPLKLPLGKLTAFEAYGEGATIGLLKKGNQKFLIIVSHDPFNEQIIKPTIYDPSLFEMTRPNYVDINNRPGEIILKPGGYMIYRWEE